jgi:hypothetical protein
LSVAAISRPRLIVVKEQKHEPVAEQRKNPDGQNRNDHAEISLKRKVWRMPS